MSFNLPGSKFAPTRLAILTAVPLLIVAGCSRPEETRRPGLPADSTKATAPEPEVTTGPPNLEGTPPEVRLVVPARFEGALVAQGGSFVTLTPGDFMPQIIAETGGWSYPWSDREAPSAVIADFDGNGSRDVALLQRSGTEGRAVAVLDVPPRPRVVELRRWSRADAGESGPRTSFYLRLHPAGTMRVPDFGGSGADTTVTLAHDGVEVVAFAQAARTYWYSNGDFMSITTAD